MFDKAAMGGSPVRTLRRKQGVSAEALAARCGVSVAWLRTIERAPALGSTELLARIAGALGVPIEALANSTFLKTAMW